ncbi:MAG: hypothetical protein KJ571_06425 [Bacteroidetes bacterium]|nr:hypothetical protein [Bacteroidota bacterium]
MENIFTKEVMRLALKTKVISNADDFVSKCVEQNKKAGRLPIRLNIVTAYLMNFLVDLKNGSRGVSNG